MNQKLILLNKTEASDRVRCCVRSLDKLLAAGRGPPVTKIGGKILIREDHLDDWVRSLSDAA
jgi:hypothetical protein